MKALIKIQLISYSLVYVVLLSFLAHGSGCVLKIPNIEFCRDKGKLGAVCAFWLNAKETKKRIGPTEWTQKRFGMVCTSEAGAGNINAIIEKACQSKKCVEQITELINAIK